MDAAKLAKTVGSRLLSALKLLTGALLLAIVPAVMIYFNYKVDSSGFFQGELQLRAVADMLLQGNDIVGYEQLNSAQRDILKILANNIDPMPENIALGSSRIMQLSRETLGSESFFNFAVTGGDAADVLGTFYLLDLENRLPKTVIIGFDPWLLRGGDYGMDTRSDKELYAEFVTEQLGYPVQYTKPDTSEKWQALISPVYFQENVSFSLRSTTGTNMPQVVEGDLYGQTTEVKRYDGSLLYTAEYRERTTEEVQADALYQSDNLLRMTEYHEVDSEMVEIFDRFFAYAKERGVNVVLVLTPFHPLTYDTILVNDHAWQGFLQTEPTVRALAEKYDITVYGSYNPHAIEGVTEGDFYDGLHCTGGCLEKLLSGVTTPPETSGVYLGRVLDEEGNVVGDPETDPYYEKETAKK